MNMKVKKFENSNVNFHECSSTTIRIRVSNQVPCQNVNANGTWPINCNIIAKVALGCAALWSFAASTPGDTAVMDVVKYRNGYGAVVGTGTRWPRSSRSWTSGNGTVFRFTYIHIINWNVANQLKFKHCEWYMVNGNSHWQCSKTIQRELGIVQWINGNWI